MDNCPFMYQGDKSIGAKQERGQREPKDVKFYFSTIGAPGHFCQKTKAC